MDWSGEFYQNVFKRIGVSTFALRENDYVFNDQKFAGNAQSSGFCRM
jgi:singapore isolate B (sub-type 7) whole genome shotgun sequence assembly, scaffold_1